MSGPQDSTGKLPHVLVMKHLKYTTNKGDIYGQQRMYSFCVEFMSQPSWKCEQGTSPGGPFCANGVSTSGFYNNAASPVVESHNATQFDGLGF